MCIFNILYIIYTHLWYMHMHTCVYTHTYVYTRLSCVYLFYVVLCMCDNMHTCMIHTYIHGYICHMCGICKVGAHTLGNSETNDSTWMTGILLCHKKLKRIQSVVSMNWSRWVISGSMHPGLFWKCPGTPRAWQLINLELERTPEAISTHAFFLQIRKLELSMKALWFIQHHTGSRCQRWHLNPGPMPLILSTLPQWLIYGEKGTM